MERSISMNVLLALFFSFFLFFLPEKLLSRHCHEGKCEVHPFAYINLIGKGIHNFIDDLIIVLKFSHRATAWDTHVFGCVCPRNYAKDRRFRSFSLRGPGARW